MEEHDRRYLAYIQESIDLIFRWAVAGRENFLSDDLTQSAVLFRLETLAEAAGELSPALRDSHPQIAWHEIAGFRNRVAHGYFLLDLDLVWRVIEVDLPMLKQIVDAGLG